MWMQATGMPGESFTVQFWVRAGAISEEDAQFQPRSANLFSYATESLDAGELGLG
jgi:hypothetical protein